MYIYTYIYICWKSLWTLGTLSRKTAPPYSPAATVGLQRGIKAPFSQTKGLTQGTLSSETAPPPRGVAQYTGAN